MVQIGACSHEPETVNYTGASITSCLHDDLLSRGNVAPGQLYCPRARLTSSDHYEFIRIPLVFVQTVAENEFKTRLPISGALWNFLLGNLFQILIMSICKTTLAPRQLLRSVHMEKSYLGKAG